MRNFDSPGAVSRFAKTLPLAFACHCALFAAASHAAGPSGGTTLEEVVVLGRGATRQMQSINAQQIEYLPAGTSPLKAIEKLPGVNFQSADPYGSYEWSTRITVRGFNQNRLGYTLDDVPLGDMTYGNHNGLHISRAVPSENVANVTLSQGAGAIDTASANNLGGVIQFSSAAPLEEFGAQAKQMIGSDSARRSYFRLDSGQLGSGTRLSVSAVDSSTDKWKGGGDQEQRMYNLKVVQPLGAATLTGYYNYSDRVEIDYQDLSFDIVERHGWDWDNWYPNWSGAVGAAQVCNARNQSDVVCDDAYWNASGLRKDDLAYLALDLPFGESVRWRTTAYMHTDEGQGLWGTPYVPTPGGAPLSIRTTEYDLDRTGFVTGLTLRAGSHEINLGGWYETNDFTQARRFYGETSLAGPTRSFEEFQRNPLRTDWEYDFETQTVVFHLQDTWSLTDALRLNVGFRSVNVENNAKTVVGPVKTGVIEADESFLPQIGLNWTIADNVEIFASAAENVRAFASSGTSGPFSTSAEGFAAIRDIVEPETSTNYEAGVRWRGATIEALLAAYHVDFEDRLVGIPQCVGIVGCFSAIANVGSVKTDGVEAALSWRPVKSFTWFTSAAWNDSKFDDDYTVTSATSTRVVRVSGRQVPDAPELLLKTEFSYDNGTIFARLDANYTDERFYSYLNDASVPSYTLLNAGVGIRFTDFGVIEELTVQADVTNLADKRYFGTIDSNGFPESDLDRNEQTLLRAAPRQAFLSVKARF
jgi:iron complex outermembrane recepter protein